MGDETVCTARAEPVDRAPGIADHAVLGTEEGGLGDGTNKSVFSKTHTQIVKADAYPM